MKYFIIFSLLFGSLYAKECYKNKHLDKTVCYYKYFDRSKIYKAKSDERYYKTKNGSIYAISDEIEVKFKAIGAILTILDDYEMDFDTSDNNEMGDFRIGFNQYDLEFLDKTRGDKFIFRVKKPDALFIILRKLNELESIQSAVPVIKRKFTKVEIQQRKRSAAKREAKASSSSGVTKKKTAPAQGFQGGNFLKGGVK